MKCFKIEFVRDNNRSRIVVSCFENRNAPMKKFALKNVREQFTKESLLDAKSNFKDKQTVNFISKIF